jgi:hypothetical protein
VPILRQNAPCCVSPIITTLIFFSLLFSLAICSRHRSRECHNTIY